MFTERVCSVVFCNDTFFRLCIWHDSSTQSHYTKTIHFPLYLLLKICYYCFCSLEFFNSLDYFFSGTGKKLLAFTNQNIPVGKSRQTRIIWISLTSIMLLHIVFPTDRQLFQRKWGLTTSNWSICSLMVFIWKNVSLLVTAWGTEQNGLSTATDIYCLPRKPGQMERDLTQDWVCGSICLHNGFSLFMIWYKLFGIYDWSFQDLHVCQNFLLSFYLTSTFTRLLKMSQDSRYETKLE